jgi:predicted O-methyltransferase YrrM
MSGPKPVAKFLEAPAVASNPAVIYPYAMKHMRESAPAAALREEGATLEHSVMMGAPDVAALLAWLVRLTGAKKVLEVGTFRGSTTLWIAQALPSDGKIIALDINTDYVKPAFPHWDAAGVTSKIDLRIAPAIETMTKLIESEAGTFDLIFIDADKPNYGHYYDLALTLAKQNGIIAVDNTLWGGDVATVPAEKQDEATRSIAALNERILVDKRVDSAMLPIADGLTLVRKL